jgi:hypothetical protein
MLLNKLKKMTGIMRIQILKPNFKSKQQFTPEYIFTGCICLNMSKQNEENYIFTNYIPGVIDANFITYKEKEIKFNKKDINWDDTIKVKLKRMSKQWDFLCFEISNLSDFISFPKINKIIDKSCVFSSSSNSCKDEISIPQYNIYGLSEKSNIINTNINIIQSEKMNLIHDQLPNQIYYLCDLNDSYSGSIIYKINENMGNYKLEILGITSNDYYDYNRIVPLTHFSYDDILIKMSYDPYTFSIKDIFNIPIIKNTLYPIITSNYSTLLKKNDIIVKINHLHISDMNIYNHKLHTYQSIDEYLTYFSQTNSKCRLKLIRNKQIIDIIIDINILKLKTHNDIYIDINDLYVKNNNIKFSTDISDYILENEIYNKDIIKYMDDFTYKITEIELE